MGCDHHSSRPHASRPPIARRQLNSARPALALRSCGALLASLLVRYTIEAMVRPPLAAFAAVLSTVSGSASNAGGTPTANVLLTGYLPYVKPLFSLPSHHSLLPLALGSLAVLYRVGIIRIAGCYSVQVSFGAAAGGRSSPSTQLGRWRRRSTASA